MTIKIDDEQATKNKYEHEKYERINKLSAYATIEGVEQRFETEYVSGSGDKTVTREVSRGWYIRIGGSSAVNVGMKQPPSAFRKGARVKHSIELAPELPKEPAPADVPRQPFQQTPEMADAAAEHSGITNLGPPPAHRDRTGTVDADVLAKFRGDIPAA